MEREEHLFEALCKKGKAYAARRKAAGEKHGAYLMGRAVKVCKGQMSGKKKKKTNEGEGSDARDKASMMFDKMKVGNIIKTSKGEFKKIDDKHFEKVGKPGRKFTSKQMTFIKEINEEAGEVNVFGYQTQHFDVCPGAQSLYKAIDNGEHGKQDKDLVIRVAKLQDSLFYIEKVAKEGGIDVTPELIDTAQNMADLIMSGAEKMKLEKEHNYIQGHVDTIKALAKDKTVDEVEVKDNTEFVLNIKHLLDKHVEKGGEIEEDMTINEVLALEIDENITEAKYKGKTVKLNSPMRGDVKKFKVYVANGKNKDGSIKVKKVNFGHGGTSAKRPTMRIRKSDPKRRKAFRARHRCDTPGPKTMARYWSCKKW